MVLPYTSKENVTLAILIPLKPVSAGPPEPPHSDANIYLQEVRENFFKD